MCKISSDLVNPCSKRFRAMSSPTHTGKTLKHSRSSLYILLSLPWSPSTSSIQCFSWIRQNPKNTHSILLSTLCGLLLPADLIYQTLTHTQPLKPRATHCLFLISSLLSQGKYENPVPLLESHHYILHHIWSTQNCSSFLLHSELL